MLQVSLNSNILNSSPHKLWFLSSVDDLCKQFWPLSGAKLLKNNGFFFLLNI